jgi:nitroreductase
MSSKKKQSCTARDLLKDIAKGSALSNEESCDPSSTALVRAADIDQLPRELREQFWEWMRGQTMPLIDGEPWVYSHDWQRFLRWYSAKTDRQPGRLAGKIQISDDFDDPI